MAATPKNGTLVFVDKMGNSRAVDFYLSDVANAQVRFDAGVGAGATSPTDYFLEGDCYLTDISVETGTADTTKFILSKNGVPTGNMVRYTIHLSSLNNRPKLSIPFAKKDRVGGIMLA